MDLSKLRISYCPVLHCEVVPVPTFTTLPDIDDEDEVTEDTEVPLPVQDYDDSDFEGTSHRKHLHKVSSVIW